MTSTNPTPAQPHPPPPLAGGGVTRPLQDAQTQHSLVAHQPPHPGSQKCPPPPASHLGPPRDPGHAFPQSSSAPPSSSLSPGAPAPPLPEPASPGKPGTLAACVLLPSLLPLLSFSSSALPPRVGVSLQPPSSSCGVPAACGSVHAAASCAPGPAAGPLPAPSLGSRTGQCTPCTHAARRGRDSMTSPHQSSSLRECPSHARGSSRPGKSLPADVQCGPAWS